MRMPEVNLSFVCSHCTCLANVAGMERMMQAEIHTKGLYSKKLEFKLSRMEVTKGL